MSNLLEKPQSIKIGIKKTLGGKKRQTIGRLLSWLEGELQDL